jgi:hypothetical protein
MDAGTLSAAASLIGAFGVAMLVFRVQREADIQKEAIKAKEKAVTWLPIADQLMVVATLECLLLVIIPLVLYPDVQPVSLAAVGSASILMAGYIFAILAHYRIIMKRKWIFFGDERKGPREQFEPPEVIVTFVVAALGLLFFLWKWLLK